MSAEFEKTDYENADYETIIKDIRRWDKNEVFYREAWQRRSRGESLDDLREREDVDAEVREWALNPNSIDPYKTEEEFFASGRNVVVRRHPRYLPSFTHRHAFFEMMYVLSGHCQEITNDRRVELREGDICILAPDVDYGIEVFDDSIVLNVLIRYSTFAEIFYHILRDKSPIAAFFMGNLFEKSRIRYLLYHTFQDTVIRNYILEMYREQFQTDAYADNIACSFLGIFFSQLTRRHGDTVEIPGKIGKKTEYDDEMLRYIFHNYDTATLEDVAAQFHFSKPYCSRRIIGITGMSFSELLTRIRLQNGENMLTYTQMSIADISERVGYKNPETFVRCFERYYQMTPGQYRKSRQGGKRRYF